MATKPLGLSQPSTTARTAVGQPYQVKIPTQISPQTISDPVQDAATRWAGKYAQQTIAAKANKPLGLSQPSPGARTAVGTPNQTMQQPPSMISPKAETIGDPTEEAAAKWAGVYAPQVTPTPNPNPDYKSILGKTYEQLSGPQAQFQYNAENDQAMQAAAKMMRSGVGLAQSNTNARSWANGQGGSSWSQAVGHQIAQQAEDDISTKLIPQYEQQAYGRWSDDQTRARLAAMDMMTVGQGYNTLDQQDREQAYRDENLAINKGQMTGSYLPPIAEKYIQEALANKRNWLTSAPEEQQRLASRNQELYGSLNRMGIDASSINQDIDISDAVGNATRLGVPTLQKQQIDYGQQKDQRDFDRQEQRDQVGDQRYDQGFSYQQDRDQVGDQRYNQEFEYQQARDQIKDEQYKQQFDEDVRRNGLDYAMRQAAQSNQFANAAADNSRANSQLQLQQDRFDFDKQQAAIPKEVKPNANAYKSSPEYAKDYQYIKTNPEEAKKLLSEDAAEYINEYGFDGYMDLFRALPKESQDDAAKLLASILGG